MKLPALFLAVLLCGCGHKTPPSAAIPTLSNWAVKAERLPLNNQCNLDNLGRLTKGSGGACVMDLDWSRAARANRGDWNCVRTNGQRSCSRTFPAGDGCNTCTEDESGGLVCTLAACSVKSAPIDPKCQPKKGETIVCQEKP